MIKVKRQVVVEVCIFAILTVLIVLAFTFVCKAFDAGKSVKANVSSATTTTTAKATTTKATTKVAAVQTTKKAVATTTVKATTVVTTTEPLETTTTTTASTAPYWGGEVLNASNGRVEGPSGQETYYNLDMSGVLNIMYGMGFSGDYWIRDDGCKMFGDYIMVAADLSIRPRGSIVQTSLGYGIVCDTGSFIYSNPYQLDIATCW